MERIKLRTEELQRIYFIVTDAEGHEIKRLSIEIMNGAADLSPLPTDMRVTFERFGLENESGQRIFPKDGAAFLRTLLTRGTSGYRCFVSEPTSTPVPEKAN